MQIDTEHLKSLLERVTPGEWSDNNCYASDFGWELGYDSDGEAGKNGGCSSKTVHACGSPIAIVMVPAPFGMDDICDANAELMAMSKTLARRVIAAEKLAEAARCLSYKVSTEGVKSLEAALSEWDKSQ